MTNNNYAWTDNPTVQNVAKCDTDILNECLMHLKYDNQSGDSLPLFTAMAFDHVLTGDEAIGWALAGSCVTMTYPDAVEKIKSMYTQGVEWEYRGVACKKAFDGRFIADIAQKSAIDELYVTTGIADFYVLDLLNNQFYLPRNDRFVQGTSDPNKVNAFNEAGLPNIKGRADAFFGTNPSGAVYSSGTINWYSYSGGTPFNNGGIDASRSNPIYGKSETVQPASSLKLIYYKVGKTVVNESLIDVGQVLSDLQLKADIDLTNATPSQAFKNEAVSWGLPDYTAGIDKTSSAGSLLTATTNGWIYCQGSHTSGTNPNITVADAIFRFYNNTAVNANSCIFIPISKSETYKTSGTITSLVFYPLKGAN